MRTYIFNITICCLLEVFAGVLVPEGVVRKSVLTVISLYLLYSIFSPVLKFVSGYLIL